LNFSAVSLRSSVNGLIPPAWKSDLRMSWRAVENSGSSPASGSSFRVAPSRRTFANPKVGLLINVRAGLDGIWLTGEVENNVCDDDRPERNVGSGEL
jgi:hypothetical protein